MNVTIYSLGDHEIIRAGLNAIAMLFDSGNTQLLTGAGSMGLGYAAGFGLMVSLAWIFMRVLLGTPMNPGHLLVILLAYVIAFVPKTTVYVEDIYSGQVGVVANVPLGVAIPGGIVSSLSHSLTTKLDQALRLADSATSSLSKDGFVAPLKLILAARGAVTTNPATAASLSRYIDDCTDNIPLNARSEATGPNVFLDTPFPGRLTLMYSQQGASTNSDVDYLATDGIACHEAAANLQGQLADLISSEKYDKYLSARMDGKRPNGGMGGKWASADLQDFIYDLAGAGVDAQQVMLQLATSDVISDTYRCGPLDTSDALNCAAAMRGALEGHKGDAAGRAGVFTRTMIPSMNVFMFLFFAVAPIIAVVMVMSGMHGITKILPNYLLFGVWTQTWMPVAAIINHFIQRQAADAASVGLLTADGLPLKSGIEFYDLLSTKIAAAADLLAATPLVSLALISGSVITLSHLANRASDKFDEKAVTPGVTKNSEAVSVGGHSFNQTPFGTMAGGAADNPFSLKANSQVMDRISAGVQAQVGQARTLADTASSRHASSLSSQLSGRIDSVRGAYQDAALDQSAGVAIHSGQRVANSAVSSMSEADRKAVGVDFIQGMAAAVSAGQMEGAARGLKGKALQQFAQQTASNFAAGYLKRLGAAGKGLSAGITATVDSALQKAVAHEFSANKDEYDNWSARYASGQRSAQERKLEQAYTQGWNANSGAELSARNEDAQRIEETAAHTGEWSKMKGTDISMSPQEIAARSGPRFLAGAAQKLADAGVGQQAIRDEERDLRRRGLYVGNSMHDKLSRRAVALASLMAKNGMAGDAIGMLLQEDNWDTKNFLTPTEAGVSGQAAATGKKAGDGAGLAPDRKAAVLAAESSARDEGDRAEAKTGSVPKQIAGIQQQAQSQVGPNEFATYRGAALTAGNNSNLWSQAVARAKEAGLPQPVLDAMAQQHQDWMASHTFDGLAGQVWDQVKSDPSAQALVAAVGVSAAAPALAAAGGVAAQKGWGAAKQFLGQVLNGIGKRAPAVMARAGTRHVASSALAAAPVAGTGAAVVANAAALGVDLADTGQMVWESIQEARQMSTSDFMPPQVGGNPPVPRYHPSNASTAKPAASTPPASPGDPGQAGQSSEGGLRGPRGKNGAPSSGDGNQP